MLVERLREQGHEVVDLGTDSDSACDYPEFACAVANAVRGDPGSLGVLACATGQGMAIAAGKVRGIRAVVPATVEAARLSRFDNNANVLCLAGRLLADDDAFAIVDTWLATGFAGGRHARRIAKVAAIETASAVAFVTESERLGLAALGIPARLFDRDPSLFTTNSEARDAVRTQLAWLGLPAEMTARLPEISAFAEQARRSRFQHAILLVEDAERSPAAMAANLWGSNGLRLHVVGARQQTNGRATLQPLLKSLPLASTLVLVVAGSDASEEILRCEQLLFTTLAKHCGDEQRAGQQLAAITQPESRLAETARGHHYRSVFLSDGPVEEDSGVLGFAGIVPAALAGLEPARLLARARAMADGCRGDRLEENPGVSLGVLLGAMAKHGRSKVTLIASQSLGLLPPWIARVLTRASRGGVARLLPVIDESLLPRYPPDRVFVHLLAEADAPALAAEPMEALHIAGHPYIQISVHERHDLLAEMYRWQVAAMVVALLLGTWTLPAVDRPPASLAILREETP